LILNFHDFNLVRIPRNILRLWKMGENQNPKETLEGVSFSGNSVSGLMCSPGVEIAPALVCIRWQEFILFAMRLFAMSKRAEFSR